MGEGKHQFLTSLAGIIGGLAALTTALVSAYMLITKPDAPPAPTPAPVQQPQPSPLAITLPSPAPAPAAAGEAPFSVAAVIEDPDGYVNVRAGRSTRSRIVATVRLNEPIRTHPQTSDWWLVRTRDGTQGYIHASRIRMIQS